MVGGKVLHLAESFAEERRVLQSLSFIFCSKGHPFIFVRSMTVASQMPKVKFTANELSSMALNSRCIGLLIDA